MAISGTTSALVAAFAFGIVVNAASGALFLNVRGHGSSVFRDSKRLVLAIFLFSATMWAQVSFVTTMIGPPAENTCQIAIIFTTLFDQLARYSIEQHLLWVINNGTKVSVGQIIPQVLLCIRFVLGAVFVGLSRPQFNTVCVPVSSALALAVTLVVVDAVAVAILAGRAISVGLIKKMQDGGQESAVSKAVVASLIGLAIWMATSVAILLGLTTTDYIFRSAVPASGLTILLIIVTASIGAFANQRPRNRGPTVPEALSPTQIATAQSLSTSRSNEYPPSRYEDLKGEQITSTAELIQPKELPFPNQGLPTIANPGMTGQGVGGYPVQGQLFPPMRAVATLPNPLDERQQEKAQSKPKTLFSNAGVGPSKAIAVGKLAISAPVLQQSGSNPLDKVATTDLDTAARKERERRALVAQQKQSESITPEEVAAATSDPENGVVRATSTVRNEMTGRTTLPALPNSTASVKSTASGAQLPPGGDELRRRSPRHVPSTSQGSVKSVAVPGTSRPPSPPPKSAVRALPTNQNAIIRTNIPPSRQLPPSPDATAPEPAKTPLQRRPTNGLPGNPRSTSVRRPPDRSAPQTQQTVMFVNNIIYDDPSLVESVVVEAKERGPNNAGTPPVDAAAAASPTTTPAIPETPGTSGSVVHRPRPVPRRSDTSGMDIYFPPTAQKNCHKKSKSAGSLRTVKSMLQTVPGSPTNLPPLPLLPRQQIPSYATRPKPNDTKSMTYDEKMTLLFPQPTNLEASQERRSSVPSLPRMPASFMSSSPTLTDNLAYNAQYRDSKRTTTSVQTRSLFDDQEEASNREQSMAASHDRPSAAAYQSLFLTETGEDVRAGGLLTDETKQSVAMTANGKRASSPILPARFSFRSATTTDDQSTDDATTEWGTVHSPAPVQQIGLQVHQARAIEVGKADKEACPDQRAISALTTSEEMTIMLDTSVAQDLKPKAKEPSIVDRENRVASGASSGQFYRRFGDKTLSFSSRPDKRRSRRGPPPVPLVLINQPKTAKQPVLAKATEPSPLPSPEEALLMIQAQLKKYEQPGQGSIESPGQGRLALLNDLEAEMGQQETRWLGMQNDLSRDSFSTVSPTAQSRRTSEVAAMSPVRAPSSNSSTRSKESIAADRRVTRMARMGSISSTRSSSRERDDSRNRATLWQRRLAEAQMEYMENANDLIRKRSLNFLSVVKADLGSPTPPDSEESEGEIESRRNLAALLEARAKHEVAEREKSARAGQLLWTPRQEPEGETGLMWVRPKRPYEKHLPCQEPPLPGLSVRPAQRKESAMLSIKTTQLWEKQTSHSHSGLLGLWKSPAELRALENASRKTTTKRQSHPGIQRSRTASGSRPLTQRPPRRSKRITVLPDIVEDPQPLPDKRGILGIFKFPWGEKSNVASVQSRPALFSAMPGTMSTGGRGISTAMNAKARGIGSEEHSSSFFDDNDEDAEDQSDSSSDMGSENDDEFDESTLWEIASLLKTDNIPSTKSLFPPAENSMSKKVGDHADKENKAARIALQSILLGVEEPDGLQEMPSPLPRSESPKRTQPSLWQATRGTEHALSAKGLPQPKDWHNHDAKTETARAKPRAPLQPALIESDNLWVPSQREVDDSDSPMWSLPRIAVASRTVLTKKITDVRPARGLSSEPPGMIELSRAISDSESLWKGEGKPQKGEHGLGLPHPANWQALDNVKSTIRAKTRHSKPAVIESDSLWQASFNISRTKNWPHGTAPIPTSKLLWEGTEKLERGQHEFGLPQPDNWDELLGAIPTSRSKPRQSDLAVIASDNLWQASCESGFAKDWLHETASIATSKLLWENIEKSGRVQHKFGLPQPNNWDELYRAVTTSRHKPRQSDPSVIESVNLWRASPVEKPVARNWLELPREVATSQRLWQVTKRPERGTHCVGLPHPPTWASYDNVNTTIRAKPRQSVPAVIESVDLWQAPSVEKPRRRNWLDPMSNGLWQVTVRPRRGDHSVGLPQVQSWDSYNDIKTTVRAKPRQWAPAVIESANLWQAPQAEVATLPSKMWAPRTQTAPVMQAATTLMEAFNKPQQTIKLLWSAPVSQKFSADSGLFSLNAGRSDFRTSTLDPAAVDMSRKPRSTAMEPLEPLGSTTLWFADAAPQIERNWISLIPSPKNKAFLVSDPVGKPATPAKRHYRPTLVASKMGWDAALRQALAASGYPVPLRNATTLEQWNVALDQAVAASYPVQPRQRNRRSPVQASVADWDAALAEAVSMSYGIFFDASKCHPVFASQSLASAASETHPAATGYTYDVAVLHPVFFGSGMITCPEENIHPAMCRSWFSCDDGSSREEDALTQEPAAIFAEQAVVQSEDCYVQEQQIDPALLAQIEALEQERLFAERWASNPFTPVDVGPEIPLSPVVIARAQEPVAPEQGFEFDFEPRDVAPAVPLAPLSMTHLIQAPAGAPKSTVLESPVVRQINHSDTFQSVSEMSETESVVAPRDSLVSADTPTESKPVGF